MPFWVDEKWSGLVYERWISGLDHLLTNYRYHVTHTETASQEDAPEGPGIQ